MINEIELIESFIKKEYGTKENFATYLGMTRQNLNYHFRQAKENGNKFKDEFITTLWLKQIDIIANVRAKKINISGNLVNEDQAPYGNNVLALNKIIEMQSREIERLKTELEKERDSKVNKQLKDKRQRSA